eukprot:TRINITY_DN872_c0_g1_i2.p1 TRINITY_DN872_c0_g1~~TRINITY_DN872_c0_g1_i2.p1  ORF type:complete len:168 (-),score=45.92 TRINITY_DN872_c0_g1_i2:355-858(-)
MDNEEVLLTAWMTKEGHWFRTWRSRFFVMTRSAIGYFETEELYELARRHKRLMRDCQGMVKLEGAKAEEIGRYRGREFVFCVTEASGRKTFIQTPFRDERESWVTAIKLAAGIHATQHIPHMEQPQDVLHVSLEDASPAEQGEDPSGEDGTDAPGAGGDGTEGSTQA